MRDWLKKQLEKKEARKRELTTRANAATTVEELRSINTELESLNTEISDFRSQLDALPEEVPAGGATPPADGRSQQQNNGGEARNQNQAGGTGGLAQVLASFGLQSQSRSEPEDYYSSLEYRKAFMEYARTGTIKPELKLGEQRADAMTTVSDVTAIIPTTILNEVISQMKVYGQVFSRVRKLNIQGGVEVPILSLKPIATWIGETPTSDKQKIQVNTKITFSYYGLECKVSTSLLANTVTLDSFESLIVELIVEAMIKAMDMAVIKGSGVGQPLGVTIDTRIPGGNSVTMTAEQMAAFDQWAKRVLAKLPLAYKSGSSFFMASGTFEAYINGMVDANGQPIGRINYGITNGPQERFAGREVILVEDDVITPFDSAANGDVVAILINLKNYAINSNMTMRMFRYLDHDTNEYVDKAILIADGKILDPNGVILIKKA